MKKLILLFTILFTFNANALEHSYVVLNADTGDLLYKSAESKNNYPASLTKLMVLYITFDALEKGVIKEDQKLKVSYRATQQPQTKLGLKIGDTITVKEAIYALIIKSANDAAVVLSENIGTTENGFSDIMTAAAAQIGLQNTSFKNASGLTDENQYCTAYDMAMLGYAIYSHFPQYFKYFKTKEFKYKGKKYVTHNNILNTYEGGNGMKTGYTDKSGYNLIASATRQGKTIIAVSLGNKTAKKRDKEVVILLDYGFQKVGLKNQKYKKIDQDYKVQLGAFYNKDQALKVVEGLSAQSQVMVSQGEKGIIYKPQLVNLTFEKANQICENIKKKNKDCLVVRE